MERSNYNRGGGAYNRGGTAGGRSRGGRGFEGAQDGGRGDGGRGNNGGYYPRDGGRGDGGRGNSGGYYPRGGGGNRNYQQQQYGNQQQEQYGGGRGRGYGGPGGGRGQQTYRTPAYPRQNADLVPDRFGGDRGVRASNPVPSGQPVQNPVAYQRVPEVPRAEVRSESSPKGVERSKDDAENSYVPITRPDRGSHALYKVKLLVNHFPVKFDPSKSILRYDIDVKHDVEAKQDGSSSSQSVKKAISKPDLRVIQEKLCSEHPDQFPLLQTAYDGEKNIFSAIELHAGTYNVQVYGRSYTCTIKYGNELNLSKLQDFLDGNAMQVPRDVLQALDVVMKANLFREKVSVGRGMYPRELQSGVDLGGGVAAYRGSQQSLKATSNGLVMCTDYSVMPFRKRMPVIDFLKEYLEIHDVNDIAKCKNKVMVALRGLSVSVTHRRTNQKYIVSGLTEKATRDISFELEDLEGNKEAKVVRLTDYFQEKWGKEIKYKGIPCLKLGNSKKPNYVPMEFCFLAEDRRFPKEQLGKEAAKILKDLSLLAPDNRKNEIYRMVSEEYETGRKGAEMIQKFEVEVGMQMTEVDGRVMIPPRLKLGSLSGKANIVTVDKVKRNYNLLQGKTLVAGIPLERWALIDFSSDDRRHWINVNQFVNKLMNRCKSIGVHMKEPILVHQTAMWQFNDHSKLARLIEWVVEECGKKDDGHLQMIICVMSERHDGYKHLKWVTETRIGVMTQCCLSQNINKGNSDQFLANLGMKINAKLGGSNVELIDRFPHFSERDRFMFIGADVNHPAASNTQSPSVAAVVGSVNWPAATRYAARVSPQAHRKEEIVNFGKLCLDLVNSYAQVNGVKPNKIVVFRDGVSDGQFEMVLNKEMVDMKKAIYTSDYRPFITFVVAQKRHTTRLFLKNGKETGNMPPGTVVDTGVVHPVMFDFYLCSHFGAMGTSKATHYTVIWDENRFSSDEMQKLVYHLCYIFARCTKPVSLVPPVYYADLVAYRGRMFQEVVMGIQPSGSQTASFDQYWYDCEQHLKDSMFFI